MGGIEYLKQSRIFNVSHGFYLLHTNCLSLTCSQHLQPIISPDMVKCPPEDEKKKPQDKNVSSVGTKIEIGTPVQRLPL